MTLTQKHRAVLRTLAIASKQGKELKGLEIAEQTRIPFLIFWERNISFSEVFPLLKDLEDLEIIVGRMDDRNADPLTGARPRYYRIA